MSAPADGRAARERGSTLEEIIRRDRLVVAMALSTLAILAWAYILWLAAGMADMRMADMPTADMTMSAPAQAPMNASGDMAGMSMTRADGAGMLAPAFSRWSAAQFAAMFVMWTVMMIGMMTPSAAPMILLYGRVGRTAHMQQKPFAGVAWFAGGYFATWTAFSLIATVAQWGLEGAALLSPMMASNSNRLGGAVLVATGVYELTPLKRACLAHCQSPLTFLQAHGGFRRDPSGAFLFGAHHGLYCIGCCWALMALLFVGGVMNVIWIAALSIIVLAEKVLPYGNALSIATGVALLGAGVWLFLA